MDLGDRLKSYIFTPLAIEPKFGLTSMMKYMISAEDGKEQVLSKYKEMNKAREPKLYCSEKITKVSSSTNTKSSKNSHVAVLTLDGVMSISGDWCTRGIDALCNELEYYSNNSSVAGIVIKAYCGGGEVLAAQRLGLAIDSAMKLKPVVFASDFAASGAYWAAAKCSEIVAIGNLAEFGSIGVVIQYDKERIEQIKETIQFVYAKGSEDKHSSFKNILDGNLELVQDSMKPQRSEFVRVVKAGRKSISEDALSGHMYTAKEAKKLGMVDHIGDLKLAIRRTITLSNKRLRINNAKNALNV